MATTTTNYGWDIPQSTDLVKDGATAIATLGQDIDTSIYTALGGNKSGMVHLSTVTFSAVASQAFDSVFSATYDNYYITVTMTTSSSPTFTMVMRTSAVDNTNANYNFQRLEVSNTGVTGTRTAGGTSWAIDTQTDTPKVFTMEMLNPFSSTNNTFLKSFAFPAGYWQLGGARFSANTSFDGFKIICSTGNMTGTAKIYGLAN